MYGKIANDDTALPADCERGQSPWDRGPVPGWQEAAYATAKIKAWAQAKQGGPASVGSGLGGYGYAQAGRPIDCGLAELRLQILELAIDSFGVGGTYADTLPVIDRARAYEDYVLGTSHAARDKALDVIAEVARRAGA